MNKQKNYSNFIPLIMRYFLRKLSTIDKNSLLRVVGVATLGSGLLYANSSADQNTRLSVLIKIPTKDVLPSVPWRVPLFSLSPFTPAGGSNPYPLHFSRSAPSPASDANNPASSESEHCSRCFTRDTIANAAAKVSPAVVNLSVPQGFYGLTMGKSIGSGTIINADGTILTCAHVVVDFQGMRASSKGKVEVTLQDGRTFEGTVLNADFHSDIAIVKIKSKLPLPAAKLGSSSKLRPGDWVVAMGCPLSLQNTVTAGIVSCVDRKSSDLGLGGMRREYLQTDCAINAGNSGGPLVNMDGEVVGVNNMKVLNADGLCFAVPIDSVNKIIDQFKKKGRVIRPWLGLKMIDLNEMILSQLKERDPTFPNVDRGVLVPMVTPGSPADCAGFRPGDVVIEFDGKPVASIKEVIDIMEDKVGKPLKVVVKRANNAEAILTVIPEEANPDM